MQLNNSTADTSDRQRHQLKKGEKCNVFRSTHNAMGVSYKEEEAVCRWIHPKGRFALLFYADGMRECFQMLDGQIWDPRQMNLAKKYH